MTSYIIELNSNLNIFSDLSSFTKPPIYDGRVSITQGGYKIIGNICHVCIIANQSKQIDGGSWAICTGLPKCKYELFPLSADASNYGVTASVTSNGALYISNVGISPAGRKICINGSYPI